MIRSKQAPDDFLLTVAQFADEANEYIHNNHEGLLPFAPISDAEEAHGPLVAASRALLSVAGALLHCIPKTQQH